MNDSSPQTLVLLGAGHAHAQVLLSLCQDPWLKLGQRVVVVSPSGMAPYSGMVPGWLMGRYTYPEICIDFQSLCARSGAEFVQAEAVGLQPDANTLLLSDGRSLPYDILSLNVGSTLRPPQALPGQTLLSLRPLSQLQSNWQALCARVASTGKLPSQLVAVGGGAAGFESVIAVAQRLRALVPKAPANAMQCLLVGGGGLLPGHNLWVRWFARRALAKAGIGLSVGKRFSPADAAADAIILWATGAQAHAWQTSPSSRGSLAVDGQNFVRVDAALRSVSHANIYAVGDCASLQNPRPKAGVYAVRQGPVLAAALRQRMEGSHATQPAPKLHAHNSSAPNSLDPIYQDRATALALLLSSPTKAILSYGPLGLAARWALGWKDQIDQAFIQRFAVPTNQSSSPHTKSPHRKEIAP